MEIVNKLPKNDLEACPESNSRVTYREKYFASGECTNWFHELLPDYWWSILNQNEEHGVVLLYLPEN